MCACFPPPPCSCPTRISAPPRRSASARSSRFCDYARDQRGLGGDQRRSLRLLVRMAHRDAARTRARARRARGARRMPVRPCSWSPGTTMAGAATCSRRRSARTLVHGAWDGELGGWRRTFAHGDGLRVREDQTLSGLPQRDAASARDSRVRFAASRPRDACRERHVESQPRARRVRWRDSGCALSRTSISPRIARRSSWPSVTRTSLRSSERPAAACTRIPARGCFAPAYLVMRPERIELRAWSGSSEGDLLDAIDRRAEEALADA